MATQPTKTIPRPMPRANAYMDTKPFWAAAKEGKLVLQYCRTSKRFQFFPRPVSLYTGRRDLEWREVSGRGTLYSWTVTYAPWPGHENRVPYVCALIDLEEGVRMLANLYNCAAEDLRAGLPVRLIWEKLSEDYNYPAFEPAVP